MKKRILISSVLTIVLCFSLIVGSTFALFTSEDQFDITVTSAKVEIDATVGTLKLYSAKANTTITDFENVNPADYDSEYCGDGVYNFANGGSVGYDGVNITITNITPGDKVVVPVGITNSSNVAIQYRYKVVVVNNPVKVVDNTNVYLTNALVVSLGANALTWTNGEYASDWTPVNAGVAIGEVDLSIELPVTAGNEYQDIADVQFAVIVEAVQANGR